MATHLVEEEFFEAPDTWLPAIREIELIVERDALDTLWDNIGRGESRAALHGHRSILAFRQLGFDVYFERTTPLVRSERERDFWSGMIIGNGMGFGFVLEQFGSLDPVLVITAIYAACYFGPPIYHLLTSDCPRRAIEVCGEERVKSVKTRKRVSSTSLLSSGDVEFECEIECFEDSP